MAAVASFEACFERTLKISYFTSDVFCANIIGVEDSILRIAFSGQFDHNPKEDKAPFI